MTITEERRSREHTNLYYLTEESFPKFTQYESEEEFFKAAAKRKNGKPDAGRTVRSGIVSW